MRVLLVEDDRLIAEGVIAGLGAQGFSVEHVLHAAGAEAMLLVAQFEVMILDLGLPDKDGLTLLRLLRERSFHLPVLILTARDSIADRVAGLQAGADDYLLKPFDLRELAARLHTLHRRFLGRSSNLIQHGSLGIDPTTGEAFLAGKPVDLSRKEQSLLKALLDSKGRIVTTDQLKDALYGFAEDVESNALNVHIHNVRRKLGNSIVQTVRGLGYRIGSVADESDES